MAARWGGTRYARRRGRALHPLPPRQEGLRPKRIYSDLSLDLLRGETITVMGASGSGKSVMLKMLIGLLTPDAGEILFDGEGRRPR